MNLTRYRGRKRQNAIRLALCYVATGFGLSWLALILWTLVVNGVSALDAGVFLERTPPPGVLGGGLANAIVGSLAITLLGAAVGTPIGLLAGTYIAEYDRKSWVSETIRFVNDILLSAPSIIIGLFVYTTVVLFTGGFSGLAGAMALAIIVIPVVVRTTEDALLLVPDPIREAATGLGFPRSNVIRFVCYKAARSGIMTGALLAVARISGETAPLLFTAFSSQFWSLKEVQVFSTKFWIYDLAEPIASLPVTINNFINNPDPNWKRLAWAGAFLITAAVLALSITARALGSKGSGK
jgi:phosphate transport system permease protein